MPGAPAWAAPLARAGKERVNAYNQRLCATGLFQAAFPDKTSSTMPIYAYKCESCGYAKDVLRKMSDAPLTDCPECGASSFKKQVTSAGFQLKGSGWYVTDFRGADGKSQSAKTADTPATAQTSPDSNAATTAAPATATTAAPAAAPASKAGSSDSSSKAA